MPAALGSGPGRAGPWEGGSERLQGVTELDGEGIPVREERPGAVASLLPRVRTPSRRGVGLVTLCGALRGSNANGRVSRC